MSRSRPSPPATSPDDGAEPDPVGGTGPGAAVPTCHNCGALQSGPFCARCGQEHRDPEPPARRLLREMVADTVGVDSATWRSLGLLLARPGALTLEYVSGRRRRYLSPLRLYLLTSVPFVVLAVGTPAGRSMVRIQPPASLLERAEAFRETFFDVWPWLLVAMVPLFAGVYALLLAGVRATFTRHLVFTLHLHAFAFVAFALAQLLWYVPPSGLGAGLAAAALLAPVPYLAVGLRRAYGISWVASLATVAGAAFLDVLLLAASSYAAYVLAARLV